jgi:hypothetical protein
MMQPPDNEQREKIVSRTRQLILMRETGPKSARWHAARVKLIWRLHDDLKRLEDEQRTR